MLFDENLALEIKIRHLHELVRVTRITVFAGKFASAVGIDGPGERKTAIAHHATEQGAAGQREVLNVMALADGFSLGGKARDADETRLAGIREEREGSHLDSPFVRLG
ncbi:MAG: hypothetical protein DMG82_07190 [Acidobacteria bacterium]|nr:MAG: hypothetical protein DMG82_07190 [Acidobacteriota bacterium]